MSPREVSTAIAGFILGKSKTHEASAYGDVSVNGAAPDLQSHIIIVSDTRLYREGLALSLESVDHVIVEGVADSVASALSCIEEMKS